MTETDVFLSHDWGVDCSNHELVGLVNDALKRRRYRTWFDNDRMHGDIAVKMAAGIENSKAVLIFVTQKYKDKINGGNANDNCRLEYQHALRTKTADGVICILMDKGLRDTHKWDGILGLYCGNKLYIDMAEDLGNASYLERQLDQLCCEMEALGIPKPDPDPNEIKGETEEAKTVREEPCVKTEDTTHKEEEEEEETTGWILIFHQTGTLPLGTNPDVIIGQQGAKVYNNLKNIEKFRSSNGTFHFKLVYPDYTTGPNFNEWKQSSNPVTSGSISEFEAVELNWGVNGRSGPWAGLAKSAGGQCFLGDTPNDDYWWSSVGAMHSFNGGLPGFLGMAVQQNVDFFVKKGGRDQETVVSKHVDEEEEEKEPGWTLVFHQTGLLPAGTMPDGIIGQPGAKVYNNLKNIEQFRSSNGTYHFKLVYPDYTTGPNFNEWKQSSNPVTSASISEFEAVELNWKANGTSGPWAGLAKSAGGQCFLGDTPNSPYWFSSVGAMIDWGGGLPGFVGMTAQQNVDLFVKTDGIFE